MVDRACGRRGPGRRRKGRALAATWRDMPEPRAPGFDHPCACTLGAPPWGRCPAAISRHTRPRRMTRGLPLRCAALLMFCLGGA
eukprot:3856551-Alexandrium_andersonii.AAC.1